MLPVTIQHPDGVVYHFYRSDQLRRPKGQRVIFPRNNESKAAKFISLFKASDLLKIQILLDKKDLSRLPPRKALAKAISEGRVVIYEEREKDDASDAEMALLRLDIKLLLKQIVSIEKDEASKIEKELEDKNVVEKILIYKHEYNKGFAKAAIELLTWVKDLHEVVSPTENLKRALDAGWETYRSDSKDWQETFYTKLKASNYKEVVDALGFDPAKLSKEQVVQMFEFAQLISEDDKTQEIVLGFIKEYIGAQHSLEWASFAGGAAFDIVLTALLAFFTAGVGAAAAVSAKAGRLMKPLAKLGEKFSELAKKLSKKFKPKKRKKIKVGGKEKGSSKASNRNKKDNKLDQNDNKPENNKKAIVDIEVDGIKAQRVRQGNNDKVAVIGRSMGNANEKGVRDYSKGLSKEGYDVEVFDGDKISPEASAEFENLASSAKTDHELGLRDSKYLTDDELKGTKIFKENKQWAEKLKNDGYTVVDIGNPNNKGASAFYELEKDILF